MSHRRNTKQSSGLTQPTLSFQTRRNTGGAKAKNAGKPVAAAPAAVRKSGSPSVSSERTPSRTAKALPKPHDEVIEVEHDERAVLDPDSKEWDGLYKHAKAEMGGMKAIHAGPQSSKVSDILRVFDLTAKYGPCVGMTRLERWERAKKWGLNPPDEIKTILLTQQGEDSAALRESILSDWV